MHSFHTLHQWFIRTLHFFLSYQVRSGRFDRVVKVQLPDEAGRKDILAVHARKLNLGDPAQAEATLAFAAAITPGASGAEVGFRERMCVS